MRFKKVKKPKRITIEDTAYACVNEAGEAHLSIGYRTIGPRKAIEISRWLVRYAQWSSLENNK